MYQQILDALFVSSQELFRKNVDVTRLRESKETMVVYRIDVPAHELEGHEVLSVRPASTGARPTSAREERHEPVAGSDQIDPRLSVCRLVCPSACLFVLTAEEKSYTSTPFYLVHHTRRRHLAP